MNFKTWTNKQLEERKAEIATLIEDPDADLEALESEIRAINEEIENRKEKEEKREAMRKAVAAGGGTRGQEVQPEEAPAAGEEEVRNSRAYIAAYAEGVKSGKFDECRALLTTNATNGTVPVPDVVADIVKTAWEKEGIMRRVTKINVNADFEISFEISASDAADHTEGGGAESEGNIILGIAKIAPALILKWISISKEAMKMRGEAFLRFVYSALIQKIAAKAAANLIGAIEACGTVSTTTCPSVPVVVSTQVTMGLVASAIANLSDEAANPIVMMNKLTWSEFKAVQYANGYGVDPFEGLEVEFNSSIKSFSAASTGDTFMIVGDLGHGAIAVAPENDDIEIQIDENTLATAAMNRIIGSEMIGVGVVAPKAFVKVTK